MSERYLVGLDLTGRRVLVVGGGVVAGRRVGDLLAAGARVELVAPVAGEALAGLAAAGQLVWHRRAFEAADVTEPEPAWLVLSATGTVDAEVARTAEAARVWCLRADDAAASAAHRPAVATGAPETPAEGISVAVSAGGDPRRAVAVRDAVQAALESATLPLRRVRPRPGDGPATGKVWLVGAGPGAAGLISVRGRQLLAAADVVVTDRLGTAEHLTSLDAGVEVIHVGKSPGAHGTIQGQIHELLVHHARAGRRVVRLKGGDPFVLGRGGEEVAHCRAHGVEVEVVPGITSAISVPAAAGIPVTHRGLSTAFRVVSGHAGAAGLGEAAADHTSTLVLLMAVGHLGEISAALLAGGRDPETPVAVVEQGWTPQQRTTVTTLAEVARVAAEVGVANPAVVVVGEVVAVAPALPPAVSQARAQVPGFPACRRQGLPDGLDTGELS